MGRVWDTGAGTPPPTPFPRCSPTSRLPRCIRLPQALPSTVAPDPMHFVACGVGVT